MSGSLAENRMQFNGSIRVEARPERLTSDAGVFALREALDRLGMSEWMRKNLKDDRDPKGVTYPFVELARTSILMMSLGYRDQDDADTLREESALRLAVSERKGVQPLVVPERPEGMPAPRNPSEPEHLASQPTLSRMMVTLSSTENRWRLREGLLELAARRSKAQRGHRFRNLTVDIDSLPVEVHGNQPESAFHGHYDARIYHPLVATVAETGDLIDLDLRRGNAHTAEGGMGFILPLLDRVEKKLCQNAAVRFDAGFPEEKLLAALETRQTAYVARVKNNSVLNKMAAPYLHRPAGRRPVEPRSWLHEVTYQAKDWSRSRRVVLVVQERADELFLHHFFLITNWTKEQKSAEALLEEYRQRGTAEGHMGELMNVLEPALSSSPRPKTSYQGRSPARIYPSVDSFAVNEVRLLLNAWAYNLMHVGRTLIETETSEGWSLQRFRERLLKIAGRIQVRGRRATLIISDLVADLWNRLWKKVAGLRLAEGG